MNPPPPYQAYLPFLSKILVPPPPQVTQFCEGPTPPPPFNKGGEGGSNYEFITYSSINKTLNVRFR